MLEGTLFRPLPYPRPAELLSLSAQTAAGEPTAVRLPDLFAWQDRSHTLESIAYYSTQAASLSTQTASPNNQSSTLHGPTAVTDLEVLTVLASANLFPTLGVSPALGRGFTPAEQQPGTPAVALLNDALWRSRFAADPHILGRQLLLDGVPTTIIGVMPAGFAFPVAANPTPQLWQPSPLTKEALARSIFSPDVNVLARRRPGVTPATVTAELSSLQRTLVPLYTDLLTPALAPARVSALPIRETLNTSAQRSALLALLAAVAVLWLIACANVSGLVVARVAGRTRELALRSALGATRGRLLRQSLTEALILALAAAALGLALAEFTLALLRRPLSAQLSGSPLLSGLPLQPDLRVLAALLGLTLVSALLLSLAPPLLAAHLSPGHILCSGSAQAGTGRAQHRLESSLIVAELGLTLALLVSCGLLLRTVLALRHVPLGFRTDHVFVITPNIPRYKYSTLDPNSTLYKPLLARIRTLPGVQAATLTTIAPLDRSFRVTFQISAAGEKDEHSHAADRIVIGQLRAAGPELQAILGFRMRSGRYFSSVDTPDSPPTAVVNQAFAKLYGAGGADIMRLQLGSKERPLHIIGVVDNLHQLGIADPPEPEFDINAAQARPTDAFYQPTLQAHVQLILRSTREPASLLPELRHALAETSPDLASADIVTMQQIVDDAIGSQLLAAHLLELLGALALLIALAGLYSLLAYLVTLRTRELGLRLALGAQPAHILRLVLGNAGKLLVLGIAFGLALSLAAGRLLGSFLFGVRPHDGLTLLAAAALLLVIGLVASLLPARRAASIDPNIALRAE